MKLQPACRAEQQETQRCPHSNMQVSHPNVIRVIVIVEVGAVAPGAMRHSLLDPLPNKHAPQVSHPNVIRVIEIVEVGAIVVVAMEALTGGEVLRSLGAMHAYSEGDAGVVFAQVRLCVRVHVRMCDVHAAATGCMLHRDVKPEQVAQRGPGWQSILQRTHVIPSNF